MDVKLAMMGRQASKSFWLFSENEAIANDWRKVGACPTTSFSFDKFSS